jgi:hypothetical protein
MSQSQVNYPIHFTLRFPAAEGRPERMLNVYGEDASTFAAAMESATDVLMSYGFLRPAGSAPTNVTPISAAAASDWPAPGDAAPTLRQRMAEGICPNERCSAHGDAMIESNYGGLFCRGIDTTEEGGRCRWVTDKSGLRRKPTRAELGDKRAAGTGR